MHIYQLRTQQTKPLIVAIREFLLCILYSLTEQAKVLGNDAKLKVVFKSKHSIEYESKCI